MTEPIVFYNGDCPVCRREINHYRRLAERDGDHVGWCDISQTMDPAAILGVTQDQAKRRLHVRSSDGRLLVGLPAFLELWRSVGRYSRLASIAGLPGISHGLALAYEPIAWLLYRLDIRRARSSR